MERLLQTGKRGNEMSNTWGQMLKVTIFGESHGPGIGVVIDGLPPGTEPNWAEIQRHMSRRAPGQSDLASPRKEQDEPEILSGLYLGKTTGAPLCALIRNQDTRSSDYDPAVPRPGSADLAAHIKYKGNQDYRGGGAFSGRLTAPLTFAGSIARQILADHGMTIGAHIKQIEDRKDSDFDAIDDTLLDSLTRTPFPVLDEQAGRTMADRIRQARDEKDSVGGIIECVAIGIPAGVGAPFFDSMESAVASMMFSIPAVKGIEFGAGFSIAAMRGSQANDEIYSVGDQFHTRTNNNGGINGGITNGMPLLFRVAIKPTPSIGKVQSSVDIRSGEERTLQIVGRHDPCIVPRAVVVVESAFALCLLDRILSNGEWK